MRHRAYLLALPSALARRLCADVAGDRRGPALQAHLGAAARTTLHHLAGGAAVGAAAGYQGLVALLALAVLIAGEVMHKVG